MPANIVQTLLPMLIQLLSFLVPWLGGLLNFPILGWLAKLALGYATQWLVNLLATWAADQQIDADIAKQLEISKLATIQLQLLQNNSAATEAQLAAQYQAFKDALAALTHVVYTKSANYRR